MVEKVDEKEAVDWTRPPVDPSAKLNTDGEILRVIREFKVSYPAEVVVNTGFSQQTVLSRLGFLKVQGVIERVEIGMRCPEDLKARLPGLWAAGLKGATLRRMSWYRLVDHGKGEEEK
jgi:hypothetical protein